MNEAWGKKDNREEKDQGEDLYCIIQIYEAL